MAAVSELARCTRAADRLRNADAPESPASRLRSRADGRCASGRFTCRPRAALAPLMRSDRLAETRDGVDRSLSAAASLLIEPMIC